MRNWNYDLSYFDCVGQQNAAEAVLAFRIAYTGQCFSTQLNMSVHQSFNELVAIVIKAFESCSITNAKVVCYNSRIATIHSDAVLISVDDSNGSNRDLWTQYDRSIVIHGHGDHDILAKIDVYLKANIQQSTVPTVTWEFLAGDDRRSQDIKIEKAKPIHNEFYPWIDGDVYGYFDRYLASDASILCLLGETGTAKTSFIRSMIWHASLNTMFTYEEELLSSDSLFVDFIVDDSMHLLVIEDADLFLTSREHDGNKIMSKFLNVSDGLASISKKKMVFTANITEPSRIDNALLRAGRCFDCQIFRRLTHAEACLAAKAASIPEPRKQQSYTLAELFAETKDEQPTIFQTKIGFIN